MVTILDVAKYAGVSKSTVSLVINNSSSVKDETKEKVLNAINELSYVPNNSARGLITNRLHCIGVVILSSDSTISRFPSYNNDCYPELFSQNIITGISKAISGSDYTIVTEQFSPKISNEIPDIVKNRRIDGVIIIGSDFTDEFCRELKETKLPFLMLTVGRIEKELDNVCADAREGISLAYEYLANKGKKEIAFINCAKEYKSFNEHSLGYYNALVSNKKEYDSDLVIVPKSHTGSAGFDAAKELFDYDKQIDAVIISNSTLALGALNYFYQNRILVPDDISVVVYGDSVLCGYASPPLTAINIQKEEMGYIAALKMVDMIEGRENHKVEVVYPYLVERDSVT